MVKREPDWPSDNCWIRFCFSSVPMWLQLCGSPLTFLTFTFHISEVEGQEFPDDPVVRTWRFHCQGRVQSLVGVLISHKTCGMAQKKKKKVEG